MNPEVWPSEAEIRDKYLAFPKLQWALFCESIGMDDRKSRGIYPFMRWRQEKISMWGEKRAEDLAAKMFEAQFDWHDEVLKTIKEIPETANFLHFIIKEKLRGLAKKHEKNGTFDATGISMVMIQRIANVLATISDVKMQALQITKWNMQIAQGKAEEFLASLGNEANPMKLTVAGKGELTVEDIRALHEQWMDKPNEPDPVPDSGSNE